MPTVAGALQGAQTEGIWLSGGKLYHVVGAPVLEGGTRVAGVIVAAFQINDEVARSLKTLTNAEAVFFADEAKANEPRASGARGLDDAGPERLGPGMRSGDRPDLLAAVFRQGKDVGPLPLELAGDTYLAYFLPIRSSTDQLVGAAVALRSRAKELAAFRQIQNTQLLVGALALLVAFPLSYLLAHRITGPVGTARSGDRGRARGKPRGRGPAHRVQGRDRDPRALLPRHARGAQGEGRPREVRRLADDERRRGRRHARSSTRPGGPARTRRAARSAEPQLGSLFAGRYEIQGVLGKGGMGIVYRAHDRDLDDLVAIKTLRSDAVSADPSLLDRFKQEIRLARRITHPNILRTHDLGEANGLRYLSMEYVKGITLKHLVETDEILPLPVALRIAKQMCAGLAAAHEAGVIHRDIKPQNILIEPTGGLKIMDFGIARLTEDRGMTATGTVIGTPDYMSPEQARGLPLDFRSDIYSTGVVLYELFTGTLPFEGDSPLAVVLKHVQEKPPSPQAKNPKIDPRVAAIILKCMQKDPADRYHSVNELYEALIKVTAAAA